MNLKIGVLACQGAFLEHIEALKSLSKTVAAKDIQITPVEVRSIKDLSEDFYGLIIPGGESTTLNIFLGQSEFFEAIKSFLRKGRITWGTCSGMILLSDNVQHQKTGGQLKLGGFSITTCRNFFGRQKESFEADIAIVDDALRNCMTMDKGSISNNFTYPGIFIRAPGVVSIDNKDVVQVLATLALNGGDETPVALRQDNYLVTSFHPELTKDLRFHKYFIDMILENAS